MQSSRDRVLGGLVILVGLLTAFILLDVLGTVFFAFTVAYAFTPIYRWLRRNGLPAWWASAVTTTLTFAGAITIFLPIVLLVYIRRHQLLELIGQLPSSLTVTVSGYSATVSLEDLIVPVTDYLQGIAPAIAQTTIVLLVKVGLFALVLFALFIAQRDAHLAVLAVVPDDYHDVVEALVRRARETLYAIYVLQALTGFATFLIALPVFYLLGYPAPFSLAVIAGLLQFAPIVGPSILVGALAVYHLTIGELAAAVLVVLVAGVLVAWVPDLLVRPRFARRTAHLPGSLYFVGFTGGVFSLGPIGIVAGPLVVALFAESVSLLADHRNNDRPIAPGLSRAIPGDIPPEEGADGTGDDVADEESDGGEGLSDEGRGGGDSDEESGGGEGSAEEGRAGGDSDDESGFRDRDGESSTSG